MRRIAYILMVGLSAGTGLYLLLVIAAALNTIIPLYGWAVLVAVGILVAALVDFLGPSPE